MAFDPNYAPPGFEAAENDGCLGCVFKGFEADACDVICGAHEVDCAPDGRPDKAGAVFIVRRQKPATANFPHDDMGTPV